MGAAYPCPSVVSVDRRRMPNQSVSRRQTTRSWALRNGATSAPGSRKDIV